MAAAALPATGRTCASADFSGHCDSHAHISAAAYGTACIARIAIHNADSIWSALRDTSIAKMQVASAISRQASSRTAANPPVADAPLVPLRVTSKTPSLWLSPANTPSAIECDSAMPASAAPATSLIEQGTRRQYNSGPNSALQAKKNDFRGPDVFVVMDTDRHERKSWVVWEEDGRTPDVVIEIMSASTEKNDRGDKKRIYAKLLRRYFRRGRKLVRRQAGPEELHRFRIRTKRLRYVIELYAGRTAALADALRELREIQSVLGSMQDQTMIIAYFERRLMDVRTPQRQTEYMRVLHRARMRQSAFRTSFFRRWARLESVGTERRWLAAVEK